jgi:two-component system, NtrC family, nitrogen regulation response regulator NtrX
MASADAWLKMNSPDVPAGGAPLLLTGHSPAVTRLRAELTAAGAAGRVLLVAEPGLEIAELAADLHDRARGTGPFIRLECASAEPPIVERVLFGPALVTGGELEAIHGESALARADGGALFLGDVAELSAGAQARLARIARDGEVLFDGAPRRLDVRLFASVGPEVDNDVTEGRLRRDLVRHLARTRIAVPPLRQRVEDLPTLVEHLVLFGCAAGGVPVKDVTQPAMTLLAALPWRGNLQELRTAVERLVTVDESQIQLEDVLRHVRFDGGLLPKAPTGSLREAREQFERDYVTLVLRHHHWRVSDAARTLGIQRTNLYRKARQLGIAVTRPEAQG